MTAVPSLELALSLLAASRAEILPRFRNVSVSIKPDGTEVTEADREAERALRAAIERATPGAGVLGEELGASATWDGKNGWVVDPVDGTAWFTLGIPTFGTLISYLRDGEPVLGIIDLPAMDETVFAARGEGCWRRIGKGAPERVRVASVDSLAQAYGSASGPHASALRPGERAGDWRIDRVIARSARFRFCGDCIQYALLAQGKVHVALDPVMKPWDIAALVPCVLEAGGCVATFDGRRTDVTFGGSIAAAANEALLAETLGLLAPS